MIRRLLMPMRNITQANERDNYPHAYENGEAGSRLEQALP